MAAEKKQLLEMIGEFLREAAVLVLVFVPLDFFSKGQVSWHVVATALAVSQVALVSGIILERIR